MMTGLVQDQHLEKQIQKQMGCMSGFFQLFDRQQILSGKRMYSTKRLPPATGEVSSPAPAKSVESPVPATPEGPKLVVVKVSPERPSPSTEVVKSPLPCNNVPETPPKSPLPLPIFELKEGTRTSWKFCKEAPRLSLDSRATVDAKGSLYPREIRTNRCDSSPVNGDDRQRRSPSVIGRLMGLEPLPSNTSPDTVKKQPELRRSASESRVSRDLFQSRFVDVNNNFQNNNMTSNAVMENVGNGVNRTTASNYRAADPKEYGSRNLKAEPVRTSQWRSPQQRRSYFDSADFFPEPKQTTVSIFGEIEKRLKMRGIDEQSTDLETLKQILEALQLKGLLHSKKPTSNQTSHRNFVYDRSFAAEESPIVVMKPWRSPSPNGRAGADAGMRRNLNLVGESIPSVNPRRERNGIDRNVRSPVRSRNSVSSPTRTDTPNSTKSSNSIVKRKPLSIQTQRRANETPEPRRVSPVQSPKLTARKSVSDQSAITNRSPRNKKPTPQISPRRNNIITAEDESSSISESTVSTSSLTDTERSKMEEYREGRNLLKRCDKLLDSIAEMNGNGNGNGNGSELQPSPVSVLDSSFYKDESSSSPSPVMKRSIDFKDSAIDLEDELWSPEISPVKDDVSVDDADFVYVTEILRAIAYLPEDSDVFFLLEKQQYLKGKDTSRVSKLQRKLTFDVIIEILDRNRQLPPWKAAATTVTLSDSGITMPPLRQIWSEYQGIREREAADDLLEVICGALKKDLAGISGWGEQPVEMSEAVLDIERLIFKDLVSETIGDLAEFSGKSSMLAPRRKLVF